MPPNEVKLIPCSPLIAIFKEYDKKKTWYSTAYPSPTIKSQRKACKDKAEVAADSLYAYIETHPWNTKRTSATDVCVTCILTTCTQNGFELTYSYKIDLLSST